MNELEIRIAALREFREKVKDLNVVLYTDFDKKRYTRVKDLVDDEIESLQNSV